MTESTIACPTCNIEFPLTASLAASLIEITRWRFAVDHCAVSGAEVQIATRHAQDYISLTGELRVRDVSNASAFLS